MPRKSLTGCILLLIYLTIPFYTASVGDSTHQENFTKPLLDVPSTSPSTDIRTDKNAPVVYASSTSSDNAHKVTVRKHQTGNTNDMGKIISARQVGIIWKRIHELLLAKLSVNESGSNASESNVKVFQDNSTSSILEARIQSAVNQSSEESDKSERKLRARGRQFLFHPYSPYGKEVMPDEKISFHDVLPVKMVKFIKGMVEEAPWEQMFMKMVRMVVDQFVDKIIEKMFSHDEGEGGKWRSFDSEFTLAENHPNLSVTTVERLRRSAVKSKSDKEDEWSDSAFQPKNRLSKADQRKEKGAQENDSWLDSILDYLFPEDHKSDMADDSPKTRRKRDIESSEPTKNLQMPDILNTFFVKLYELQTGELASEQLKSNMKKVVHNQLLSSVFEFQSMLESNSTNLDVSDNLHNSSDIPSGITERWRNILSPQQPQVESGSPVTNPVRTRRSAMHSEEKEDLNRLWQANRRSRPMNFKSRGECSLRRACNTGRLLARLPSVKDITLQLKNFGNEPHWDALVWGMAKKKCSKIFCKRQRSPKGSKHRWDLEERRHYRNNIPSTRSPRFKYDESDPATISSLLYY